jgi:lipopolysaccharide assembly outer membrane protein LptD (OstA)
MGLILTTSGFSQGLDIGLGKSKAKGEEPPRLEITADGENSIENGIATARDNVELIYGDTSLYADEMVYDTVSGWATAHGNVRLYSGGNSMITSDHVKYNLKTKETEADAYRMEAYPFYVSGSKLRTEKSIADNLAYRCDDNLLTSENDPDKPGFRIRPRTLTYDPTDNRWVMTNVTMYAGSVPIFWLPRLVYNPGGFDIELQATPGYRSEWGAFLLLAYGFEISDAVRMKVHLDTRSQRGVAGGGDLKWIYGDRNKATSSEDKNQPLRAETYGRPASSDEGSRGQGRLKFYVAQDIQPRGVKDSSVLGSTFFFGNGAFNDAGKKSKEGSSEPEVTKYPDETRYRLSLDQRAHLTSSKDVTLNLMVNRFSDPWILRDFSEGEFSYETQPDNYVELMKWDDNFTASLLARKQINKFFETTEREPEVAFELKRQRPFQNSPLEYQNQNSVSRLRRRHAEPFSWDPIPESTLDAVPNDYGATRFDTFHQLSYPGQYFGWLNLTPRLGWRGTYYDDTADKDYDGAGVGKKHPLVFSDVVPGSGGPAFRSVVNAGFEASFKLTRTWEDFDIPRFGVDGLRHIAEPFMNFSFIPTPNVRSSQLFNFDKRSNLSSRLQPLDFPEYNSIDSIDETLITRLGVRNRWQTLRDGEAWTLLEWDTYMDVDHNEDYYFGNPTSNWFNELTYSPASWLRFQGLVSTDLYNNGFDEYNARVTWQVVRPFDITVGVRTIQSHTNPPIYEDSRQYTLGLMYRVDENWTLATNHVFEAEDSTLEYQSYSVYRDLGAFRASFTSQVYNNRGTRPTEYIFYLALTLKAAPSLNIPALGMTPGDSPVSLRSGAR